MALFQVRIKSGTSSNHSSSDRSKLLKARVIVSSTERTINPWLSFIMSLLIPGLGEVYAGTPLSGIVFSLSRIIALLAAPFYSFLNSSEPVCEEVSGAIIISLMITFFSAIHAFIKSRKKKSLLSWYNSAAFYSVFSCVNIFLTLIVIMLFFSFFEIKKTAEDYPPLFRKGEIILIKKIVQSEYSPGDVVICRTVSGEKILRVLGIPGERVEYSKGRFFSEDSELPLSIFTEEELKNLSLTDFDVISEQNGTIRYAVKNDLSYNHPEILLTVNEYFLAPDIRIFHELFLKKSAAEIKGRVEGILISTETGILPGKTSLPSENSISAKNMK